MGHIRTVKTAIVGCGMISDVYIRNLKHLFSIVDLVALCDYMPQLAKQKAEKYGIGRVMTMEEIAKSDEIELVVNLTNPSAHYSVIREMLLANKHVYTEKMLAANLEQGRQLLQIANERNLYLGVAPDTVLGAGVQTARKLIDSGMIGRVTSCVASVNRNQSLNSEVFPFIRKDEAGAFIYDVGVYYIAALLSLLGPVKSVCGFAAQAPEHTAQHLFRDPEQDKWTIPGKNLLTGALEFASGALGSIHFNGVSINEEQTQLTIFGTEGIVHLGDPNSFNGTVRLVLPESEACTIPFTHGYDGIAILENATPQEHTYGHRGVGVAEMAWAMRMARANRLSKEFGLHTMEVLCGLGESAGTGRHYEMTSTFEFVPLPSGYYSSMFHGMFRSDAERSLIY